MKTENKVLLDDYTSRINRVTDYMDAHIEKPLTLEELATVSHFSKFHFSRIFWGYTGETPFEYLTRLRMEKAASILKMHLHEPIIQVALKCGYTDKSVFSRNFRSHFKVAPSLYRKSRQQNSNNSQLVSNSSQPVNGASEYFCNETQTLKRRPIMELIHQVEVKQLPAVTLAYLRHTGPFQGDGALFERLFNKIFTWAGARGLLKGPDIISYAIYHDDISVTDAQKVRLSICVPVSPDTKVDGEIGKMELNGGKHAIASFTLTPPEFPEAWRWFFGTWFPTSGYQPDDSYCFEMYYGTPKNGEVTVDICVPVRPL